MNIFNLAFWLLFQSSFPQSSPLPNCQQEQKRVEASAANIIFRSADGGQTWQDISKGLPVNSQGEGFFANDNGLYLRAGNGIYHSKPNSTAPFWKKEISLFADKQGIIAAGKFNGLFFQKIKGTSAWLPWYANFQGKEFPTVFETPGGRIFIESNNRLYKSTNSGIPWKMLITGGLVIKMVESKGVLLAAGPRGIMRSTDDGENWYWVIKEGGVGIDVAQIKGGFAAINYSSSSKTRRVRTSYDGGKTWQPIDAGLPAQLSISSIIEVGENFFCGHPTGIFRSSDKGKTWKLLLPSVNDKVFNLSVSGNVIYAISRNEGC